MTHPVRQLGDRDGEESVENGEDENDRRNEKKWLPPGAKSQFFPDAVEASGRFKGRELCHLGDERRFRRSDSAVKREEPQDEKEWEEFHRRRTGSLGNAVTRGKGDGPGRRFLSAMPKLPFIPVSYRFPPHSKVRGTSHFSRRNHVSWRFAY